MWRYSRLSILIFGISAFGSGVFTLVSPESMIDSLDLSITSIPSLNANGLAATAMGVYYTLAAYQNNIAFFKLSVPMRLLTTVVFLRQNWVAPAVWEGGFAIFTALALLLGW